MADLKTRRASVMCVLCRDVGIVETNLERSQGAASVAAVAGHFTVKHPQATAPIAQHLVILMLDTDAPADDSTDG